MKRTLSGLVVMFTVIMTIASGEAFAGVDALMDGKPNGIPFPAGQFASSTQGSIAICLDPSTFAEESCTTPNTLVLALSTLQRGSSTTDQARAIAV